MERTTPYGKDSLIIDNLNHKDGILCSLLDSIQV
jgi:hypothetical protein